MASCFAAEGENPQARRNGLLCSRATGTLIFGASTTGWKWLQPASVPGWTVAGVGDFDGSGVPDLVWQNDATRQVTVNYYGGAQGASMIGWNWLNAGGAPGWRAILPR